MTDVTIEELQAQLDAANAKLAAQGGSSVAPEVDAPVDPNAIRETSSGATVIGAAPDSRGGYVIGYSDGTVTLVNVPNTGPGSGQPWGSAPEGEYVYFFITANGDEYNFVTADKTIETVSNPVRHFPPAGS